MNSFVQTWIGAAIFFCSLFFNSAFCQQDQNNNPTGRSTITIRSMRIENGDTIITEKHYQTEGNANIDFSDSLNGMDNSGFYQFRYNMIPFGSDSLDFGQSMKEMEDFMRDFNLGSGDLFDSDSGFNRDFPLMPDTIIRNFDLLDNMQKRFNTDTSFSHRKLQLKPKFKGNNLRSEDFQQRPPKREIFITEDTKNIGDKEKQNNRSVPGFEISMNQEEGYINLSFMLNSGKPSIITFSNAKDEVITKENTGKGQGQFTRQFDLTKFPSGVYYLNVKQGHKFSGKRLIIQ